MANFSYQRSSIAPGGFAIGIISATAVIVAGYLIAAVGYEYANRSAVSELIQSIESGRMHFSIEKSPILNPPGFRFVQRSLGFGQLSEGYARSLSDFLHLSTNSESSYVWPAWERLDTEISKASNLESIDVFPRSKIAQLVKAVDEKRTGYNEVLVRLDASKKKHAQLYDRFSLAHESFAELLGFTHLKNESDGEKTIAFYSGGVLSELPIISGLPDEIPDLPSLRDILLKLKATVAVTGPDAQELFLRELARLQTEARDLAVENTSIQSELAEFSSNLDVISKTDKELRAVLISTVRANIDALTMIRH